MPAKAAVIIDGRFNIQFTPGAVTLVIGGGGRVYLSAYKNNISRVLGSRMALYCGIGFVCEYPFV